jgi:trehalose-6-phosphatase
MKEASEMKERAKVYAVDFDGTLSLGRFPKVGEPNKRLFGFLIEARKKGDKVILWTCRGARGEEKWLDEAVEYCRKHGLEFDKVNDNLEEVVMDFGFNPRKVVADVYIDDLGMEPARFVLNEAMKAAKDKDESVEKA